MTSPTPPEPAGGRPVPFVSTPNAERYLLEADNLRRRQLRSALLHGSSRTWRDRRRIWPAVVAGIIVVAVISAAIAIYGTFQQQQRQREQAERERQEEQQQLEQGQPQREPGPRDQSLAVVEVGTDRAGGPVRRVAATEGAWAA